MYTGIKNLPDTVDEVMHVRELRRMNERTSVPFSFGFKKKKREKKDNGNGLVSR